MRNLKTVFTLLILILIFLGCSEPKEMKRLSAEELKEKLYASWLAQCIGNIYGLPHENKHIDEPGPETFPYGYGAFAKYLEEFNGAFSDDDTDFEYLYLLQMEKYGPEPTYAQLADAWKYHIRERVWLANRAALGAMHYGYDPPVTGLKSLNPHWFQIDPQLINEIWAVTAPGMVTYAAEKSAWAARITDDDWGIEPTVHYGAMYAAAYFESDVYKLIDIGTAALPEGSRFAAVVEEMKVLYQKYPEGWKQARKEMAQKYYYDEPVDTRTIWNAVLNGACGILALLYGEGDFQKTLDLACAMGFDADNQAATMSGLLGVAQGMKGLPKELLFHVDDWEEPFNDSYKNVTRHDMPDASLKDIANRMVLLAEKIILKNGGKKISENGQEYYLINSEASFSAPLEFPGSPQPYIVVGAPVDYQFYATGGQPPYQWQVLSGAFPEGLTFTDGRLSGTPTQPGIFPVTLQIKQGEQAASRDFKILVRDKNLAANAVKILANISSTNTDIRDEMWLTVGRSLYAESVKVINDGKRLGNGSTFYSISDDLGKATDYYGYQWDALQNIGLLGFHTGSMEESGGWFNSLNVEYRDENGNWQSVDDLLITPPIPGKDLPFDKPHFVEYLLAFPTVETTAIRIIGPAGAAKHWRNKTYRFTSITELSVHGAVADYKMLAQ